MQDKVNILMVDDRPENLLALQAILEPLGQNLVKASSGPEALRCVLKDDFAVILLDVQMPGMDGFETALLIKEREKSRHIPIIFVTAISKDERYVFQGYTAGAVDYIFKPFDPAILKSKVSVFVDVFRQAREIQRQGELLRQAEQREKERQMAELERELERRHMAELAESEARFRLLLENVTDYGILILDVEGRILTWSVGARHIFGHEEAEVRGGHASLIFTPEDIEDGIPELEMTVAAQQGRAEDERWHRRRDGTRFWASGIMSGLRDGNGELRGFAKVLRDSTARKLAEEALVYARDEAERANRAKSDFISSVSHELRTPLNAIIGFSKLLLNPRVGPLNDNQELYTRDIVQGAEHLLQLINDILDLSKIEAGKLSLDLSPCVLPEILQQSLTIVREKAMQHHLSLHIDIAPEVAALPPLLLDERKIKQIMYNLLSNAVKFTPDGGSITVSCELRVQSSESEALESRLPESEPPELGLPGDLNFEPEPVNSKLVVSVRDTGIGIAPEHQERVFGAFEQVDSSHARQQQGTGLGLALTKRLVELHNGQMHLSSAAGEGSTFSFDLPLHLVQSSELAPATLNPEL